MTASTEVEGAGGTAAAEESASESMARFVTGATWSDLDGEQLLALKVRILDAIGCAGNSLNAPPNVALESYVREFGGPGPCTLIAGGKAAPDRAGLYNAALIRYLDFNDGFPSWRGGGGHPSDHIGPILAASEYAGRSGKDFLVALAIAYQVQTRLVEEASNTRPGQTFDHPTTAAYAVAAATSYALGLDAEQTAQAIGMAGAGQVSLRVTRTGALAHWKGLAGPFMSASVLQASLLAARGITGPRLVIEGKWGLIDTLTAPFHIDWPSESLDSVTKTTIKPYNAQVHCQAPTEALLELRAEHGIDADRIAAIDVDIFKHGFEMVGGGQTGSKAEVRTKEAADHSLPFVLAAASIDGEMTPRQYLPDRLLRPEVHDLMRRVTVRPDPDFTARYPQEHACRVTVTLADGTQVSREKADHEGLARRPMAWERVQRKARSLWDGVADLSLFDEVSQSVRDLEHHDAAEFAELLGRISRIEG